jgi:hypothetical protein
MSVIGSPVRGISHCTRWVRAGRETGCRIDEAGFRAAARKTVKQSLLVRSVSWWSAFVFSFSAKRI